MKTLYSFINRKNVILHMTLWGIVSGALLGVLYLALALLSFYGGVSVASPGSAVRAVLMLAFTGMVVGGGAGLLMGFANGLLMGLIKQSRHLTLSQKKRISYGINLVVVLAALMFSLPEFRNLDWFLVFGAPAIVATGASLLATDRHFTRLVMAEPAARKSKQKHAAASI